MSSDNILNISDFPVHKNNGIDLDILEDEPPKKGNTLRPSHSLLDPKCAAESLVGADESVEEPSICKVEETYDLYHGYDEADWQTKPQAPEKSLSKSVRENDVANVEKWMSYVKWVEQEKAKNPRPIYHKSDPRYDPNYDIPLIDLVDDYDPHYNAVHNAVITNNVKLLNILHAAGADLTCLTNDQAENPPLVLAVFRFSDNVVQEEMIGQGKIVQLENETKTTFHALLKCHKVREQVNEANHAGITALHAACRRGNVAMVNILLGITGIDINQTDNHDNTPLHSACAGGNSSIVAAIIDAGAKILDKNKLGMHPFHAAVVNQSLDVVKMLQTDTRVAEFKEELLHAKENDGNTMFLLAVKSGDDEMVKFLLDNGARIGDTNYANANVFHLAASVNSRSIMEMIYSCDASHAQYLLEAKDSSSLTPLHHAARRNQKDVLSFLIDKCDKLEVEDAELNTPLLMAATEGSSDTMHVLIEKGAKLTCTDGKGNNIVHLMVSSDNANVLKEVLDNHEFAKSTLIDYGNWTGQSALHKACKSGFAENCIELLKRGANPNLKDINGCVPLHYAAESGSLDVIKLLLNHHANVDAVDDRIGRTPLCVAAYYGNEAIVELLLQSGAHIDGEFSDSINDDIDWKTSPLFASCINGHVRIVKLLLERGADVTIDKRFEDDEGRWSIKGNCLVLATLLGQSDVALCIINSPKWKSALRWRASNDEFGERTPLKLLISQMPDVAEVVLSKCIKTTKKQNGTYVKKYYYEFLDDYHSKSRSKQKKDETADFAERGHHNWIQHAFKKEAHAYQVMIDNKRIELLNHPLSTQLLTYKWRSYGIFIYYINLISYLIFLGFLTGFILTLQNPKIEECMPRVVANSTVDCQGNGSQALLSGAAAIIITFSLIRISVELFQIYYRHFRYFLEFENWMELYLYSSSITFVGFGLAANCQCPEPWQWEFGAVTLLIAWLNLVLFLKKFPLTGVYVLMFIHILTTILKILLLPILFVVSFGLTFYMLFFRPDIRTAFSSPANSMLRTMMLTLGEFDFDTLFFNTEDDSGGQDNDGLEDELLYPGATYALWIVFVIVMPIVLTNLLIGLAVDDIKGIQDEAHLTRLALEVDFTLHIEEIGFIRNLFIKRIDKEYYTPDTQKFADSRVEDYPKQVYNLFQRFKLYYFGRSKTHQDDIKVVEEKSSTERIEEEISEIGVIVADVRKRVKDGITNKEVEKGQTGVVSQSKELTEVKKMLAEHRKKQDRILMLLEQVCSKHPESFAATATSGSVYTPDEGLRRGRYHLESSLSKDSSKASSDDNEIDD